MKLTGRTILIKLEIRPGQAKLLAVMRRLAPAFMNRQLWKASKKLVPVAAGQAG